MYCDKQCNGNKGFIFLHIFSLYSKYMIYIIQNIWLTIHHPVQIIGMYIVYIIFCARKLCKVYYLLMMTLHYQDKRYDAARSL